jgi:clan AA aspartic protease
LETEAVIDTGFSGSMTLPRTMAGDLGLDLQGTARAILADGSERFCPVGEAFVWWHGQARLISVSVMESAPLLWMALLHGSELALQVVEGGEVIVREMDFS